MKLSMKKWLAVALSVAMLTTSSGVSELITLADVGKNESREENQDNSLDNLKSMNKATPSNAIKVYDDLDKATPSNIKKVLDDMPEFSYMSKIDGYEINIYAEKNIFPKDTEAVIKKVESVNNQNIEEIIEENLSDNEQLSTCVAFDITFYCNGEEIQPQKGTVQVSIKLASDINIEDSTVAKIFHIDDESNVEKISAESFEEKIVTYQAEEFSVYAVALTEIDYIPIYTAEELKKISGDKSYILMNDIDLADVQWNSISPNGTGILDGRGYTIKNLTNNQGNGLFSILGMSIKNLNLKNFHINVNASSYAITNYGVLAKEIQGDVTLNNINIYESELTVYISFANKYYNVNFGAIGCIGRNVEINNMTVDCDFYFDSEETWGSIGGIVGWSDSELSINKCCYLGNINTEFTEMGRSKYASIGGIIGTVGYDVNTFTVEECANMGVINSASNCESGSTSVGGLIGVIHGWNIEKKIVISNSYNAGNIEHTKFQDNPTDNIGGLIGSLGSMYDDNYFDIINCYSLSAIKIIDKSTSKDIYAGTLIGHLGDWINTNNYICIKNNYYMSSNLMKYGFKGYGITEENTEMLSSEEMKNSNSFLGFDFDSIWQMGTNEFPYPILQWQTDMPDIPDIPEIPDIPDEELNIGWINFDNGKIGYNKFENNQCIQLKDGIYRLHFLSDDKVLYEGNWKFDSNGYVISGIIDGHYYYDLKDKKYPYGMEVMPEDLKDSLKTGLSSSEILGKYNFFDTFRNDLTCWDFIAASHPLDGIKEIIGTSFYSFSSLYDEFLNFNSEKDINWFNEIKDYYMNDVSINKKVIKDFLKSKMEQNSNISSNIVYKSTKKGIEKVSSTLSEEFEDRFKSKIEEYRKNENGNWSESFQELMTNANSDTKNSYIAYLSKNISSAIFTVIETDEKWQKVFMDYSEQIDFLESINDSINSSSLNIENKQALFNAVNEVEKEYKNMFFNTLFETVFTVIDETNSWRELITGNKNIPILGYNFNENIETNIRNIITGKIVKFIPGLGQAINITEILQKLAGGSVAIDRIIETESMHEAVSDLLRSKELTIRNEENLTTEDIIEYLNIFELLKYITITRYKGMKEFYIIKHNHDDEKDVKAAFLDREISKLEKMSPWNRLEYQAAGFVGKWDDIEKRYYYYNEDRKDVYLKSQWKWIDDKKYYFDENGHPYEGLKLFDENGHPYKNDGENIQSLEYYFSTGKSDIEANKEHYGAMQTGKINLNDGEYFFFKRGGIARDCIVQIGTEYHFYDKNGKYDPFAHYAPVSPGAPSGILGSNTIYRNGIRTYKINCPIDIKVYDSNKTLVASVISNHVQECSGSNIVAVVDNNDQKIIYLPFEDEYTIEMIATENGNMDYSITEYSSDMNNIIKKIDYRNISLEKGDVYYGISEVLTINNNISERLYKLIKEDELESITEIQNNLTLYSIDISVSGLGNVINDKTSIRGDYIKLTAIPENGNEFIGWYNDNNICVSNEKEYRFCVLESVHLTAKFSDVNSTETTQYIINASAKEHGIINPSGVVNVAENANQTFTIVPDEGYVIDKVLIDGNNVGTVSTYKFTSVKENHTITAIFKQKSETSSDNTPGGALNSGGSYSHSSRNSGGKSTAVIYPYLSQIGISIFAGSWQKNDKGWLLLLSDNSNYARNQWAYINGQWYLFNREAYLITGWANVNGRWYYLNPTSDNTQGIMLTGWQLINGKWYYFNEVSDGTRGAMMTDTWIGNYYVNTNGVWEPNKRK